MVNITIHLYFGVGWYLRVNGMAKNVDDNQDYEDDGVVVFDDLEFSVDISGACKSHQDARRRLEQLKEDRELQRLINDDFYAWD